MDSELRGQTYGRIPYLLSNNPSVKFNPLTNKDKFKTHNLKDCFFPKEYTRLDNPASNIKGMGPNRFEWLCLDPQNKVAFKEGDSRLPFNWNLSSRTIAKDNNRPVLPTPFDQYSVYPKVKDECLLPPYLSKINLNMCNNQNQVQTNFCN